MEDDWDSDLEIVAEKKTPEEEYIDIEDILALSPSTRREKKVKHVDSKAPVTIYEIRAGC